MLKSRVLDLEYSIRLIYDLHMLQKYLKIRQVEGKLIPEHNVR